MLIVVDVQERMIYNGAVRSLKRSLHDMYFKHKNKGNVISVR